MLGGGSIFSRWFWITIIPLLTAVTIFLLVVVCFLETLRSFLTSADSDIVFFYVGVPTYLFMGVYLVLSAVMLTLGYKKAHKIRSEAQSEL